MNSIEKSIHTGDDSIEVGCSRTGAINGATYGSYIGNKVLGATGATTGYILGAIVGAVFGPDDSFKVKETDHQEEISPEIKQLL